MKVESICEETMGRNLPVSYIENVLKNIMDIRQEKKSPNCNFLQETEKPVWE